MEGIGEEYRRGGHKTDRLLRNADKLIAHTIFVNHSPTLKTKIKKKITPLTNSHRRNNLIILRTIQS